jgi:hypothetical protein
MAWTAIAEARGPTCGWDCSALEFTACNDSFPTGMPSTANCSASLGSCTSEAFCASFGDNFGAAAFPLTIQRIYLVAASDQVMEAGMQFDLEMYQETGQPTPGPRIGQTINLSIAGSQTAATVVDFTALGLVPPTIPNPGRFRICFRKQFDRMHNICLDDANPPSAYGRNWAHVRIAADPNDPCGSAITSNEWYSADGTGSAFPGFPGINGDFIVRPDITAADPTALPGGGGTCPGQDGGVVDFGPADTGPPPDAGELEDAQVFDAEPEDTGVAKDAGEDAGVDAGLLAPEITAISPDRGKSDSQTSVLITGKNFVDGLTVKVGAIGLNDPSVGGSTTITAVVPQGIAAGVYDVIVTNPDDQADILEDGFTIEGPPVGGAPPDEGCGCTSLSESREHAFFGLLLLGLLGILLRVKRRL